MKICIVTPVYNASTLLIETVKSILYQQGLQNISLTYIVCDGGSDDDTVEKLHEFSTDFQSKNISFKVTSEPDNGMYDALAKGFKVAGEDHDIYSYINAGDYYAPYALRETVKQFKKENVSWLTGLRTIYNAEGVLIETRLPIGYSPKLIQQGFFGSFLPYIQQESTFWATNLHQRLDLKKLASFRYAGDFYLWNTFSQESNLFVVQAWLAGFRLHDGQLSDKFSSEYRNEFSKIAHSKTLLSWGRAFLIRAALKLPLGLQVKLSRNLIRI